MGTRFLYETSRGERAVSQQNASHLSQCPSTAVDLLIERLLMLLYIIEQDISQKLVHLAGSAVAMAASVVKSYPCMKSRRRLRGRRSRSRREWYEMLLPTLLINFWQGM